ncbi:hypothetical protein HS088_TW09G01404 [Tripterygium wilfordii]|uniref:CTLH domain-containing protein n=1 Tax=Tripterygium wilfordii TaxID=458696 RepID=A0A7J7DAF5_TRIWF|nr:hypothetical protein HS088_TW09G01404 [Tripterygium wilfordii]
MAALGKELIYLILQFLDDEKYKDSVHKLEQESGVFFNLNYLEELILAGKWDEAEKYLNAFTTITDNRFTMKIFFEIRKQKYLEALDKHERGTAVEVLLNDLKVFAPFNESLYKEITQLLTLEDFRQNQQLANYRDAKTARSILMLELKRLVEANPVLQEKTQFPTLRNGRLRSLINQSLNWQHSFCGNPRQNPEVKSLFVDHICGNPNDPFAQVAPNNQLLRPHSKVEGLFPLTADMVRDRTDSVFNQNFMVVVFVYCIVVSLFGVSNFVLGISTNFSTIFGNSSVQNNGTDHNEIDELPKIVARTLNQGSLASSLDFHPNQRTILLVGTSDGDICLWEVSHSDKLMTKGFESWNLENKSMALKAALVKDPCVSVKRVLWYMDGSLFGVAYSKNLVQLFDYRGGGDIQRHLELEAHNGSVNDIAFCKPNVKLCLVTGGDDKTIKVWEAASGTRMYTFEGHEAPVYSVCPHERSGNINYVFSTSVDGKIKAWLYDGQGPKVDFDAPSRSCAAIAYSTDGKRLFSCGTNKDGESHIVEWNEDEGSVRRTYKGFNNRSLGLVQFDTTKDRFLACGDNYTLKFWHMDRSDLLTAIDAEGGLPASPRIRFNKEGTLLAVTANDNRIKILATVQGLRLMRENESHSLTPAPVTKNDVVIDLEDVKPTLTEMGKLIEINEPAQFRSLKLSSTVEVDKISRLVYNSSGTAVLALASNAIHLLWRWLRNEVNPTGKATTRAAPQFVLSESGVLMVNDVNGVKPEDAVPCFALSRNDSYVISASGGKASLFHALNFKTMTTFMSPSPAATCFAFYPTDNNVIAIGTDDSTIHIYNVRLDKIFCKFTGHSRRVTGLAFSQELKKLVSFGDDAQIIMWSTETWEKQKEVFLQIPANRTLSSLSSNNLQVYNDHTRLLVVHGTQLAIYKAETLDCVKQWIVEESSAPISHATLSCDSRIVYCGFLDGIVRILDASNFRIICQINPPAYLGLEISSGIYPVAVAANPQQPNQFALGLSNGGVHVIESLEFGSKWATA